MSWRRFVPQRGKEKRVCIPASDGAQRRMRARRCLAHFLLAKLARKPLTWHQDEQTCANSRQHFNREETDDQG
jgi:hypothetical protein